MDAPIAPESSETALWQRWTATRDASAGDALTTRHLPWARSMAREIFMRVRGRSQDWPDYVQNASIGLLEALRAFRPERGVPFVHFARKRVRGAVFNGLRQLRQGTIRIEDDLQNERVESLLDEANDDPVNRLVSLITSVGLGYLLDRGGDLEPSQAFSTPYAAAANAQASQQVRDLVDRLTERERQIISMHYFHFVRFADIATALGLTKGRVSQLHHQGLKRLEMMLATRRDPIEFG